MHADRSAVLPILAEVFREYGYEGASLARIGAATGLGKGSLYHFFPGGKDEMAAAVLADIDAWFRRAIFVPLAGCADAQHARQGIGAMLLAVESYFQSGQKVCLLGVFALGCERDRFAAQVKDYFAAWIGALAVALLRAGKDEAQGLAEETVGAIQGALVLARALERPPLFATAMLRLRARLA